jgi:hypothetical protein
MTKQQIYDRHVALMAKVDAEQHRLMEGLWSGPNFFAAFDQAMRKYRPEFAALEDDCFASNGHVRNAYKTCLLCGHNPVQDEEQTARNLTVG